MLSFSANDANGTLQSTSVTLNAATGIRCGQGHGKHQHCIAEERQRHTEEIVAVKETNAAGTAEGIRFISSLNNFSVGVGRPRTTPPKLRLVCTTEPQARHQPREDRRLLRERRDRYQHRGGRHTSRGVLGQAVQKLGCAQAAIGKGQNQLGYAIDLAQSQISNFSSAQAQIRDADVASEAANLSKAQVLQQASIAAMAQANSAPQAVLSLLRG